MGFKGATIKHVTVPATVCMSSRIFPVTWKGSVYPSVTVETRAQIREWIQEGLLVSTPVSLPLFLTLTLRLAGVLRTSARVTCARRSAFLTSLASWPSLSLFPGILSSPRPDASPGHPSAPTCVWSALNFLSALATLSISKWSLQTSTPSRASTTNACPSLVKQNQDWGGGTLNSLRRPVLGC